MSNNPTTYQQATNHRKAIARCAELTTRVNAGEKLTPDEQLELNNLQIYLQSFLPN